MRCDARNKGESEEQSGFGSHCVKRRRIYNDQDFQSMKAEYKGGKKVGVLRNVRSSRPNEYLMSKAQEEYLKRNNEGDLKRNFFGGKRGIYMSCRPLHLFFSLSLFFSLMFHLSEWGNGTG